MTRGQFWSAFQVGCAYIGTVVGAGFASGQEIFQFFGRYGNWGFVGIAVAVSLFAWLGYKIMYLGYTLNATSYHELNAFLFGKRVGAVFDFVLLVMLFGVTVAMLAGAGALFAERMHVSFQVGAVATMLVTFLTMMRGIEGVLGANTIIVPTMVSVVIYSACVVFQSHSVHDVLVVGGTLSTRPPLVSLVSGIIYAAFNLGLAAGVLIPLGARMENEKTLRVGAGIGAVGLGTMLFAVMFTLYAHYPNAMSHEVPMAYVAAQIGPVLQWLFIFVLWGEIYSTLVGNVYAVAAQFSKESSRYYLPLIAAILVLAYLCSHIGFSAMVKYVYSIFGYVSTVIVFALCWPRQRLNRS